MSLPRQRIGVEFNDGSTDDDEEKANDKEAMFCFLHVSHFA